MSRAVQWRYNSLREWLRLPEPFRSRPTREEESWPRGRNDAHRVSQGAVNGSPGRLIRFDEEGVSTPRGRFALRMRFRRAVALVGAIVPQ